MDESVVKTLEDIQTKIASQAEEKEVVAAPEVVEPAPPVSEPETKEEVVPEPEAPVAPEAEPAPEVTEEAEKPEAPAEPAAAYEPNYKFKAYDQELEFEDWAKEVAKDKETEEKIRSLHAKAYAVDTMKSKWDAREQELSQVTEVNTKLIQAAQAMKHFRDNGDLDNLFAMQGIDEDKLIDHAIAIAQRRKAAQEGNQELVRQHQAEVQARQENFNLKNKVQTFEQQAAQAEAARVEQTFQMARQSPEIAPVATAWEAKYGQDSFKKLVHDLGYAHFVRTGGNVQTLTGGEVLSPQQAIEMASRYVKAELGVAPAAPVPTPVVPTPGATTNVANIKKNVPAPPPSVQRGTSAPTAPSRPKSLKDIESRLSALEAEAG